ncbi:MAG: chromate transporter [Sulfolobales archaeon]|nr:chromate transporter [Sulfolobales archaeon]MCX8198470.1 chromate transporter [Sulfolobales archaeon]MDW8169544.1 chromate transporter [Desulfurococcaceae archaeon]
MLNNGLIELFFVFLKVGLFMFGGGYASIALLHRELVVEHRWLSEEEFADIVGLAESTPGPIAINSATYAGYRLHGLIGSLIATGGIVLPAYLIMVSLASLLAKYLDNPWTKTVFRGINAAVVALILYSLIILAKANFVEGGGIKAVSIAIFLFSLVLLVSLRLHPMYVILASIALSTILKLIGV